MHPAQVPTTFLAKLHLQLSWFEEWPLHQWQLMCFYAIVYRCVWGWGVGKKEQRV